MHRWMLATLALVVLSAPPLAAQDTKALDLIPDSAVTGSSVLTR